jgi:hypothetical protein
VRKGNIGLTQLVTIILAVIILVILLFPTVAYAKEGWKKISDTVDKYWKRVTGQPTTVPSTNSDPFNDALRRTNKYRDSAVSRQDLEIMFNNLHPDNIFEMKYKNQNLYLMTTSVSTGQTIFLVMDPVAGELTVIDVVFPEDGILYTYEGASDLVENKKYGVMGEYSVMIDRWLGFPTLKVKDGSSQISFNLNKADICLDDAKVCLPSYIVPKINSAVCSKFTTSCVKEVKRTAVGCDDFNIALRDKYKYKENVLTADRLKSVIATISKLSCARCDLGGDQVLLRGYLYQNRPIYILYSAKTGGLSVLNIDYDATDPDCYTWEMAWKKTPVLAKSRLFLYQSLPYTDLPLDLNKEDQSYPDINMVLPKDLRDAVLNAVK